MEWLLFSLLITDGVEGIFDGTFDGNVVVGDDDGDNDDDDDDDDDGDNVDDDDDGTYHRKSKSKYLLYIFNTPYLSSECIYLALSEILHFLTDFDNFKPGIASSVHFGLIGVLGLGSIRHRRLLL